MDPSARLRGPDVWPSRGWEGGLPGGGGRHPKLSRFLRRWVLSVFHRQTGLGGGGAGHRPALAAAGLLWFSVAMVSRSLLFKGTGSEGNK